MTLQVFKTIDGICLYVKYAVRKLDARASLYTSSSLCIHTCKSKCLRLASGAPWYVSNRQIHEDVCSAVCQPHKSPEQRALTQRQSLPLARQHGRYFMLTEGCPCRLMRKPKARRLGHLRWPSRLNESRSALITRGFFGYRDCGFP